MGKGSTQSVPQFSRDTDVNRPNLSNGGLHFPPTANGLYRFEPPSTFGARKAVALGDVLDPGASDPEIVAAKLRVNWGHDSAHQLMRFLAAADGNTQGLIERGRGVTTV